MGQPRSQLHELLLTFVDNVYFQPPNGLKLVYPCIFYERDDVRTQHADNSPYHRKDRYQITVADRDPDSDIKKDVEALPLCDFDRAYAADDLNHDVYNLFF